MKSVLFLTLFLIVTNYAQHQRPEGKSTINCDSLIIQARELSWEQKYTQARGLYILCLDRQPNNADIYLGLSQTYYWAGSLQQALEWTEQGLILSPHYKDLKDLQKKIQRAIEYQAIVWTGESHLGISLEQESSPYSHQALVDIQSIYSFNKIKYGSDRYKFSFSHLLLRYQENLVDPQVNQNSLWNHQARMQASIDLQPKWVVGLNYGFDYWEDAWWTRFKMKDPIRNHLGGAWVNTTLLNHVFTAVFNQRTQLTKDFQSLKSQLIKWNDLSFIHLSDYGQLSFKETLAFSQTDDNSKIAADLEMKYQSHQLFLGYSRFEIDQPQYNSWDHLIYQAYKYSYSLNSRRGALELSTRAQWNYINEGDYNIRSSLDGFPRNSFYRNVYSIQPQISWGQDTQVKTFIFYNSDRYIAWSLKFSKLF